MKKETAVTIIIVGVLQLIKFVLLILMLNHYINELSYWETLLIDFLMFSTVLGIFPIVIGVTSLTIDPGM